MDCNDLLAQKPADAALRDWVVEQFAQVTAELAKRDQIISSRDQLVAQQATELHAARLKIEAITLELAHLRRMRFGASSELVHCVHYDLFDETAGTDIAALEAEIDASAAKPASVETAPAPVLRKRGTSGRGVLPAHLPRILHQHDLDASACLCGACNSALTVIGEDISEQLDVTPASFFVHQHIRPQYACKSCQSVTAAAVPAAVIDGGLAAPGLISWVLTSKFADHLPLYRLEQIAARSGVNLSRSTLSHWVGRYGVALQPLVDRLRELLKARAVLHADETPVQQLAPGKGKTERAYLWAYCSGEFEAPDGADPPPQHRPPQSPPAIVVFDYQPGRAGAHARAFLKDWSGHLMVDDYVGYKALFAHSTSPVIELGCVAHARRKFFELHAANASTSALSALNQIAALYAIEARGRGLSTADRKRLRQEEAVPLLAQMKDWLIQTRVNTANAGALARAIDYSLRRWEALSRYAQSGHLPIDNNTIENAIRPIAIGKKNWLFAGSERAGKRAAAIQSLFATAKRNHLDPHAWLKDVLEKLPTWPNRRIDELLPFAGYRFG